MATFRDFLHVSRLGLSDRTSGKRIREMLHVMRENSAFTGKLTPEKAVRILQQLGPTYVKIGQIASNRADVLPKEYCDAFEKLRADVEPIPFDVVEERVNEAFGQPWQKVFKSLDPEPLGSASIAQVHRAQLADGTDVAVKVRRPGISQMMSEDILLMHHALAIAQFVDNDNGMAQTLDNLVSELDRTTKDELDFEVELNNLVRFYADMEKQEHVSSPLPLPQYSTSSVLVMEFVEGPLINDKRAVVAAGDDLSNLGERLAQSYVTQIIDSGFFHADPHPGNIIVRDHELVWIDLGMTGSLTANQRAMVSKIFTAVATGDLFMLKSALLALTTTTGEVDHGLLLEQLNSLLLKYGSIDLADLNVGEAFIELIELLKKQNLSMPPAFTMLARGLLTIEGVLTDIAPDISLVEIVSAHVEKQLEDVAALEARTKGLLASSIKSAESLTRLPMQIGDTLDMVEKGQVKVHMEMNFPDKIRGDIYSAVGRLALALISAGLFIGSSYLCGTDMEPKLLNVPILGFFGYLGAGVLGVYVIWVTLKSRHAVRNHEQLK